MSSPTGLGALRPLIYQQSNGLSVGAIELPTLHRAVITARIRVGSAYESAERNGVSHFLEHMLFRGTPAYPSAYQLAASFEALGGTLEAGTSEDHGLLSISVPPESVPEALGLFCEVLTDPLLVEIETEKDIVREEILEGLDDEGRDVDASSRCRELCFGEHALGYPIAGTLAALEGFDEALLKRHHARHYTARNMAVMVAGPVNASQTLKDLSRRLERLEPGEIPSVLPVSPQREPRFGFYKHKSSQTSLSICFRAPGRPSSREPATDMLLRIIDDGMSTRLYHRICDQLGLCYDAGAGYQAFSELGVVEFGGDTAHDRAGMLLEEILDLTRVLADSGPEPEELERARRRCQWQFQAMADEPEALAHFFAETALEGSGQTPAERCDELVSVTLDSVHQAAQRIFEPANLSVAAVGLQRSKQQDELRQLAGAL